MSDLFHESVPDEYIRRGMSPEQLADLRAQAGLNPSNPQLRRQLLAMYQEKQHTLEEVLEARKQ